MYKPISNFKYVFNFFFVSRMYKSFVKPIKQIILFYTFYDTGHNYDV